MWTYNGARVYTGDYSCGYISFMPDNDTYKAGSCGYKIVKGKTIIKKLKSVKVRGAQDSEGNDKYHLLQSFVIYPETETAIIRVWNIKGSNLVKLMKHQNDTKISIFKMRL
jgi:hypothetical protein